MFGGNTGATNNNYRANISTRIKNMYSDLSFLTMSYWNDKISIRLHPYLGTNSDGIRQYDYTKRINTAISAEKCVSLVKKIDDVIRPAMESVKTTGVLAHTVNVGVNVGERGSSVFFEYKNDEQGTPFLYLTIYTSVDENGIAPKDGIFSYKFAKIAVMENYDPETGKSDITYVDAEFEFFYDKMKNIADAFGTSAHALAVDKTYRANNANNRQQQGGFNNANHQQNTQQTNYQAPVASFDDADFPF